MRHMLLKRKMKVGRYVRTYETHALKRAEFHPKLLSLAPCARNSLALQVFGEVVGRHTFKDLQVLLHVALEHASTDATALEEFARLLHFGKLGHYGLVDQH